MEAKNSNVGIYPRHFYPYIKLVENEDLKTVLQNQMRETGDFFNSIPAEKHLYKYAEEKWSIKEVIQHIIDTERVFEYRALAFSRKDINTLPSFDENSYAMNSNADDRNWQDLVDEFVTVRKSTIFLFNSFTAQQLNEVGKASNYETSVKGMGYTIAGHLAHHINILKERYLV
ncbi:MAG: DinB family protein [Ginsengibacter sp.]